MQWQQERERLLQAGHGEVLNAFEQLLREKVFPKWRTCLQTQLQVGVVLPISASASWQVSFDVAKDVFFTKTGHRVQSPLSDIYHDMMSE